MAIGLFSRPKRRISFLGFDINLLPFSAPLSTFEANALVRQEIKSPMPVVNGMSLAIDPVMAKFQPSVLDGYVDPTKYPFFADGSGATDSTTALIACGEYARKNYLVVKLPKSSRFKISNTIDLLQGTYRRASGLTVSDGIASCLMWIGEHGGNMPEIFLANGTTGFTSSDSPKSMLHFWGIGGHTDLTEDEAALYNAGIENIKITTGTNAGAIGVEIRGAQGCYIHNCLIDATGGLACEQGLIGSGSSIVNTDFIGGSYGQRGTGVSRRPVPVFAGCRYSGQSVTAINFSNDDSETVSITGVSIVMAASATGPAISTSGFSSNTGYLLITDCSIDFTTHSSGNVAIFSNRSIKLLNVWVRGAGKIVDFSGTANDIDADTPISGWTWIKEATICIQPPTKALASGNVQFNMVRWHNGSRLGYSNTLTRGATGNTPPSDLISRHHWGSEMLYPDSPGVVNAKTAAKNLGYTLTGNGTTDDYIAAQAVISAHAKVFFPKGYYAHGKILTLRPDSVILGVSRNLTVFIPKNFTGGDFTVPTAGNYGMITADDSESKTILSDFAIWCPQSQGGSAGLKWLCGDRSMFRNLNIGQFNINGFIGDSTQKRLPVMLISGANAGGRFWGMSEILLLNQRSVTYAMLKIEDTVLPIRIYGANLEHANEGKCVIWMTNCDNTTIFALKLESDHGTGRESPQVIADNCSNMGLLGFGGIFENAIDDGTANPPASVELNLCSNYAVSLIIDRMNNTLKHLDTIAVTEQVTSGNYVHTNKLDRPAQYSRGTFDWTNLTIPRVA